MDADGYPDSHELETIREWRYGEGFGELLDYVQDRWTWPHYFIRDGGLVQVSTGGWSGNEDLVEALRENLVFWTLHRVAERRGGHYLFAEPGYRVEMDWDRSGLDVWAWRVAPRED